MLSIVIPVHNEEPSLLPLYDRLTAVLESLQKPYEILFVDDGSRDGTLGMLGPLLQHTGFDGLVDGVLSVDAAGIYKPGAMKRIVLGEDREGCGA